MPSIRIAAAQSLSAPLDLAANLETHCRFIQAAAEAAVDVLVFPELSLSGYELAHLGSCTLQPDDQLLDPIRQLARAHAMTVVLGAPIPSGSPLPCIGAISCFPDGRCAVYRKQYLDPSEVAFATQGEPGVSLHRVKGESFSLAICADTNHTRHARDAATAGASLYLAGVLVSQAGYPQDSANLQRYAASYGMVTLMANHAGPSGPYVSAGRSAIWSADGTLLVEAPGPGSYLLMATKDAHGWTGELMAVEA